QVGRPPFRLSGRVGRLAYEVAVHPRGILAGGRARVFSGLGPGDRLLVALAGPGANLACALVLFDIAVLSTGQTRLLAGSAGVISVFCALHALVPRRVGGV